MSEFELTELWKVFSAKASDEERAAIGRALRDAGDVLDRVVETFPTYTLHNRTHACNVVRLMEALMGPALPRLTTLEAAMLLLAAYFHDIGMVFTDDERDDLPQQDGFAEFLAEHPAAYLAVTEADGVISSEISEWFCRWSHADRVFVWLDRMAEAVPSWGTVALRDRLGALCRSHNQPADELYRFPTDYLADCDLRFCAVVLRLADILDFDRSRSPSAVYRYLGLERRASPREKASDVEWRKHLRADGFRFPDERLPAYELGFVAGPDLPAVEHDIRGFLEVIEGELAAANAVLRTSSRWSDLALPGRISRANIQSQGFKYGEHRFTLDRAQVLQLFMGDRLYDDPYAFVREVLQNALDASRHREYVERAQGGRSFESPPISIDEWTDADRYRWIRVSDSGMGMDEMIISEYFLRVGRSYYTSDAFKADVRRHADGGRRFAPISRFGIGVLSCFVLGDRVEVSTRRIGHRPPVRLSLEGVDGFYVLQSAEMAPTPMPGPSGDEPGYRDGAGTTIAIRLDPRKEVSPANLRQILDRTIYAPPIPVLHERDEVAPGTNAVVAAPWTEPRTVSLDEDIRSSFEVFLGVKLDDGLQLRLIPLDLTAHAPVSELRGQVLVAILEGGATMAGLNERLAAADYGSVQAVKVTPLGVELEIKKPARGFEEIEKSDRVGVWALTSRLLSFSDLPVVPTELFESSQLEKPTEYERPGRNGEFAWSHNGIALPRQLTGTSAGRFGAVSKVSLEPPVAADGSTAGLIGSISFADSLRPELSLSRDEVRGVPWSAQSAVNLAATRAARASAPGAFARPAISILDLTGLGAPPALDAILSDRLMTVDDGWLSEPIIETTTGWMSVLDIRAELGHGGKVQLAEVPRLLSALDTTQLSFSVVCAAAVLHLHTDILIVPPGAHSRWTCFVEAARPGDRSDYGVFPPLFAVPYAASTCFQHEGFSINACHPFARWMITSGRRLREIYPGIFEALTSTFGSRMSISETTAQLVELTDRLRALDADFAPARSLVPETRDFVTEEPAAQTMMPRAR